MTSLNQPNEKIGRSDEPITALAGRRDRLAHLVLLVLAAWCVWRPAETFSSTAVLVAAAMLGLAVWGWRRTPGRWNRWWFAGAVGCILWASGITGWDPASAVVEMALLAAAITLTWLASRAAPPLLWPACLALTISALALWGLWQVAGGMDQAASFVGQLPDEMQAAAAERLASGRAFASQLLPSHLAVLFAMALPLLLSRLRPRWSSLPWVVGSTLCVVGLVLARSPVGAALALAACAALAVSRGKGMSRWVALPLVAVLVVVVIGRSDVMKLEPVQLRLDNWRTAIWVWSGAPAAGVGIGGFAQAAQAVPFAVGNRPRHAHSLPLEWLAELGPVGLLASVFAALALWRLLRRLWPQRPDLAVALAVVPVHNLVDFSFYGSGVVLAWAVLLGWAIATVREPSAAASRPARGRVVFVAAMAVMLAATVLHVTSIAVEQAAAVRENPTERMDGALQARRLAPWRVDPLGRVAAAALDTGDADRIAKALSELDRARELRPRSAALAGLRARLAFALGRAPTALAEAWTASSEQPSNEAHAANFRTLLRQLDSGADDVDP